jgi:Secretion system C-terminal sorting domain
VLGPTPQLLGPLDTLALRLHFNAATGFTDFRLQNDSTTQSWFTARAFRFRGLYYLVEKRPDAGYWVHAVRIRRGQVQGLGTGYRQMLALSEAAWRGRWPQLLAPEGDSLRLRFDRQQLRAFYAAEVDNFATYRLAAAPTAQPHSAPSATHISAPSPSLYPNPASTIATLSFSDAAPRTVQLHDMQGHLLHSYSAPTTWLTIPVADFRNGPYMLRVETLRKDQITSLRLVVAH